MKPCVFYDFKVYTDYRKAKYAAEVLTIYGVWISEFNERKVHKVRVCKRRNKYVLRYEMK